MPLANDFVIDYFLEFVSNNSLLKWRCAMLSFTESLLKRASGLFGLSPVNGSKATPLDGEIIFCKNNVCVHPPAILSKNKEDHHPGYLSIRSQEDEVREIIFIFQSCVNHLPGNGLLQCFQFIRIPYFLSTLHSALFFSTPILQSISVLLMYTSILLD